jgi:hypothetical protein
MKVRDESWPAAGSADDLDVSMIAIEGYLIEL